jgi:8-oxo-dGTP pyrophosphatase MutT (NUDIX family)
VSAPRFRVGGRVLIVDPDSRVLLLHEFIEDGSTHWLTPGGGVEPGESPREAAAREAVEETGISVEIPPDAQPLLRTRRVWPSSNGVVYDQIDHFFLAQVDAAVEIAPAGLTEIESERLIGHRWWSAAELRTTDEVVEPPEIADLLDSVSGAGTPAASGG